MNARARRDETPKDIHDQGTCSICGEDPHLHRHQAQELEEWRPGEPCVVGFKGGERISVECPYCGTPHGPLDLGWLPEHLPLRVRAACCDGRPYHIVAERADANDGAARLT